MGLSAKAAWADSFYLSVHRSPAALSPLSPHTRRKRNSEKSTAPLPWQGLWLFNGTLRGMTISVQQIWTRTECSAFRKRSRSQCVFAGEYAWEVLSTKDVLSTVWPRQAAIVETVPSHSEVLSVVFSILIPEKLWQSSENKALNGMGQGQTIAP